MIWARITASLSDPAVVLANVVTRFRKSNLSPLRMIFRQHGGAQSSQPAAFCGLGMSFKNCRDTLGQFQDWCPKPLGHPCNIGFPTHRICRQILNEAA